MRFVMVAAGLIALSWAGTANAELANTGSGGFLIRGEAIVAAPPERVWRALERPGQWWSSAHTYSGDARRMSLDLRAGACWCERWGTGQSVEHGRVVLVMEREGVRTLRIVGGLGPLQEMGVSGVLTYTVAPDPAGTRLTLTYRVTGDTGLGLEGIAPLVDTVIMEQFGRLSRFSASGAPE